MAIYTYYLKECCLVNYKALVLGMLLSSLSLSIVAKEVIEPFDNHFIMQDTHFMIKDQCTTATRMEFKAFATEQLLKRLNKTSTDIMTFEDLTISGDIKSNENTDIFLFLKPFDIPYTRLSDYATSQTDVYTRYRLVVMVMYIPFEKNSCMLGFGVFPEGWDGTNWTRFKSNKQLESTLLEDYVKGSKMRKRFLKN